MRLKSALRRGVAAAVIAGIVVSSGIPAYAAQWDIADGSITVKAGDAEGTNRVTQGEKDVEDTDTVITGESKENTVTIDTSGGNVDVTFDDLKIDASDKGEAAVRVEGNGDATIELDGKNELKSGSYNAGLEKDGHRSEGTLTIKDDKGKDGSLTAEGGDNGGAGIGGGMESTGSNIKITGGNVTLKTVDDDDIYIGNGQEEAEIDTSILLGTITKLDMLGVQVGNKIVQDFGIEVSEQPVTSENYKNLWKGYIVYDPKYKTLTAKDRIPQGVVKIRAPETDVFLNGGMQRGTLTIGQVEKKTVVGAHDVTVTSDRYDAIQGEADINCTGKVDIRSDENMAVNGSLNIYNSSEVTLSAGNSVVTGSANITSGGNVTIESTDGRAAKNLTINKAENVTITISDDERAVSENTKITASGTVILKNTAEGGRVGTVDFTQADGKKYVYYQVALHKPQFLHQPQSSAGICAFGSPDEKFLT